MGTPSTEPENTLPDFQDDPKRVAEATDREKTPYDYIIVGSGAGGGPLAARLAAAGRRVLLIDAGRDPRKAAPSPAFPDSEPGEVHEIPGFHAASTEDAQMSWQFSVRHYSDNETQARDQKYNSLPFDPNRPQDEPNRPLASKYLDSTPRPADWPGKRGVFYPRSSGIGGCTGHHAMIMATPNDRDWNEIANLTGDDSWRAETMRGYFARLERCMYPQVYATWVSRFLGPILAPFYNLLRWVALRLDPRGALDNGGHGFSGWQPTSLIDPDLIKTIFKTDKRFINKLIGSAESVVLRSRPLFRMFKKAAFHLNLVRQLDPNDLNTRHLNPTGGAFLIPLGIASQNAEVRCDDETDAEFAARIREQRMVFGRRTGVREFLLKTQQENPDNLVIASGYHVTRILFEEVKDQDGKVLPPRAIGVEAIKGDHLYEASPVQKPGTGDRVQFFTRAEVVLSGGAFNTPQLLMLSGIGDRRHLEEAANRSENSNACTLRDPDGNLVHDIGGNVRIHLPGVGRNLQDRYEVTVISELDGDLKALYGVSFKPGDSTDPQRRQWLQEQTGLYATNGGTLAVLLRSKRAGEDPTHPPDIFAFGAPAAFRGYYWNYSRQLFRAKMDSQVDQRNLWSWVILKAYTKNNDGFVRLRTTSPFDCPDICFDSFNEAAEKRKNVLDTEAEPYRSKGQALPRELADRIAANEEALADSKRDLEALVEAVQAMRQINRGDGLLFPSKTHFCDEIQPGADIPDDSDELRAWIKTQAWGHHASCTCRMGSDRWQADTSKLSDKEAVLDSRFRVHGVQGLRVVDASVFPKIPGYFILTPIFMVSEKAADTLLQESLDVVYPAAFRKEEAEAIRERRRKAGVPEEREGQRAARNAEDYKSREAARKQREQREKEHQEEEVQTQFAPRQSGEPALAGANPNDFDRPYAEVEATDPDPARINPLPHDTIGLAFSGGGIRSATFALGFLQALAERNRLRDVDFLSTVSGGGFTGSFLGRLFTRRLVNASEDPCGRVQDILKNTASAPIWWLRTQANYIFATGLSDLRDNLATYWRNLFTVHLVIGTFLFAIFGALCWLVPSLPQRLAPPQGVTLLGLPLSPWWWLSAAAFGFAVLPAALGFWLAPRKGVRRPYPLFPLLAWIVLLGGTAIASRWQGAMFYALGGLIVLVLSWVWQEAARWNPPGQATPSIRAENTGPAVRNRLNRGLGEVLFLFGIVIAWVLLDTFVIAVAGMGVTATLVTITLALAPALPFLHKLAERALQESAMKRQTKGLSLATIANLIGIPLAIFVLFVLDLLAHKLFEVYPGWAGSVVVLATLFSLTIGRAFSFLNLSSLNATYAARVARTFQGASNNARIYGDQDASDVQTSHPEDDIPMHEYHPEAYGGPLHLINVCLNETVEQASERQVRERKGLAMSIGPRGVSVGRRYFAKWAKPTALPKWRKISQWIEGLDGLAHDGDGQLAPTGLRAIPIQNDPNAFHVLGYRSDANEADGCGAAARKAAAVENLTLGSWIAVSGAAFNTGSGRDTTLPLAFFMGFINLRLGYWWDSGILSSERPGHYPISLWRMIKRLPAILFRMQSMLLAEWRGLFHGPSRRFWYLSDGGHFEVTGLYELLRRRVAFMIVTDGGHDPAYIWDDVARLTREARMDFGAEIVWIEPQEDARSIPAKAGAQPDGDGATGKKAPRQRDWNEIDLAMRQAVMKRAKTAKVKETAPTLPPPWIREWINPGTIGAISEIQRKDCARHAAIARVTYDGSDDVSWILLIKPSLAPDLTQDILSYAATNPEFPQDPTINQFFDDAQWESYRALGQQIGRKLLPPAQP